MDDDQVLERTILVLRGGMLERIATLGIGVKVRRLDSHNVAIDLEMAVDGAGGFTMG